MNYREHVKKGECLFCAIGWTIIPALHLFLFFNNGAHLHLNLKSTWSAILLLVVEVIAFAVHWYRYLTYDKKVVKDE